MIYLTILMTFLAGAGLGALACLYLTGRDARRAGADDETLYPQGARQTAPDGDVSDRKMRKQYENFFSYDGNPQPNNLNDGEEVM